MPTKLHQILAIVGGKKAHAESAKTKAYQTFQKPDLFSGMERRYEAKDDEGETLPPESKQCQANVNGLIADTATALEEMFNVVLEQDVGNSQAKSDVEVDGKVLYKDVPITTLLYLEKQLTDLHTYVSNIPTLDPAYEWTYDEASDKYRGREIVKNRTVKSQEALVLYPHVEGTDTSPPIPAQTQLITKDKVVGVWHETPYSTAWPAKDKNATLERVRRLKEAVITARTKTNTLEVERQKIGKPIFDYIFGRT
jgi:hypothetical protein